jgi:DNA-binding MarR family transcriptional regulator
MARSPKARAALFTETVWADEVVIRAIRLGSALAMHLSGVFAEHGLTALQYNVLRILYVRDPEHVGLPTGTIGAGLMVRGPDVSRLLDRLAKAKLIERIHSAEDRRVVKVRLTPGGAALVEKVHAPLVKRNVELLAHVPAKDLERLAKEMTRVLEGLP